jgi:hypothetical protein
MKRASPRLNRGPVLFLNGAICACGCRPAGARPAVALEARLWGAGPLKPAQRSRSHALKSGFELVGSEWEWMSGNGQEVPGCATPAYQ